MNYDDVNEILKTLISQRTKLESFEAEKADVLSALESRFIAREKASPGAMEMGIADHEKLLKKWASADIKKNPECWKGKKLHRLHGTLSFRTSTGKVAVIRKVARGFDAAIELVRASRKKFIKQFLRPQPDELNKELLLQEYEDDRLTNEKLAEFGLKIEKKEIFKIELRKDG